MKFVLILIAAVIMGRVAYDAAVNYRHQAIVKECRNQLEAPSWAEGLESRFCERWADAH